MLFWKLPRPKGRGLPGKDISLFNIAPFDPVLRAYGDHAGQTV
jgi:hypothetical protein